ncbi:MAG: hypothetical protein GQ540_06290 [Lutibacter sp.]|uniref:hypothetical protein n=1 Tax=Lutibacter sp. TaxID=1925666 RepID=UPI001A044CC0|nr:hypothetical protein [Lutibacter sp.]NOR28121.1 hypothetical protein [Lutibacter sp.]
MYAQNNFELIINTRDFNSSKILSSTPYTKHHTSKKSVEQEILIISNKLAHNGYVNNSYIATLKDSTFTCIYTLNNKIEKIRIYYTQKLVDEELLRNITSNYTDSYFEVSTNKIETSLNFIVNYFETKGASFTKASLTNLKQQNNNFAAQLHLDISEKRKINKVLVKGYDKFPKKYIHLYLNLTNEATFNLNTLHKLSNSIKSIPFITQLKEPAVLFTKDTTTVYLYLKKKSTNKFDGVIGFSTKENSKKLQFNGYVDLTLNNIFDKGETFSLKWKNSGENTQTLNLKFNTPYIYSTPLSSSGAFSIYKQDSTYINTKSQLNINFSLNNRNSIEALVSGENSNSLTSNSIVEIQDFKNTFIGLSYTYKTLNSKHLNFHPKFLANASYLTGNRKLTNGNKTSQDKIQLSAHYLFELNHKHFLLLKSTYENLNSPTILQNELFRIGGANSIRGFDEQSVFTPSYSVTNFEYHYVINPTTYIYSITDIAIFKDSVTNSTTNIYGIGLGYSLQSKNNILNLSYVIGKSSENTFNFNNSKVHIKITYPF